MPTLVRKNPILVGCLLIFALPIVVYLLHGMFVVIESYLNQGLWSVQGIHSYTISADYVADPSTWGEVTVENDKIMSAKSGDFGQIVPLEEYKVLSIDGLFGVVRSYALNPLCWESVRYQSKYHYPKRAGFNCVWSFIPGVEGPKGLIVNKIKLP